MVYTINGEVVFGKAFTVVDSDDITDIFDNPVSFVDAKLESERNAVIDGDIHDLYGQVQRNASLGGNILALWRAYVFTKDQELGLSGQGIIQLGQFYLTGLALSWGMLSEASTMIMDMPESALITAEIKQKFSLACKSADHMPS